MLLIEPFWNWNDDRYRKSETSVDAINRTILELKLDNLYIVYRGGNAINRTILELKFNINSGNGLITYAINRTILELKFTIYRYIVNQTLPY